MGAESQESMIVILLAVCFWRSVQHARDPRANGAWDTDHAVLFARLDRLASRTRQDLV